MDELKKLWGEISTHAELELITEQSIHESIRAQSVSTISRLQQKVKGKAWFCFAMTVLLLIAIPFIGVLAAQLMLSVILIGYAVTSILIYQELKIIQNHPDAATNLLGYMKAQIHTIKKILKYESVVALLLFPISGAAGFLLGMYWLDSNTKFLNNPQDWMILLVALVALMPIFHISTLMLNKRAFGAHLLHLEKLVDELEREI